MDRDQYITMQYDISAVHIKRHGPIYSAFDGDIAHVHPDAVADRRDRGWFIVKNAKNERLLNGY